MNSFIGDSFLLVTERCIIRLLRVGDYPTFCFLMSDRDVIRHFELLDQFATERHIRQLFDLLLYENKRPDGYFVCSIIDRSSQEYCGLWGINRKKNVKLAECFYAVMPMFRGQSIAAEANKSLCNYLLQHQFLEGILAAIPRDNLPSRRVAEKCDMCCIGTTYRLGIPYEMFIITKTFHSSSITFDR